MDHESDGAGRGVARFAPFKRQGDPEAASDFEFPAGLVAGEELSVFAEMEKQGRTSMTIAAQAWRRERDGDDSELAATGRFIFVAVDADNKPREILPA